MPVPSSITDLSTTASMNSPAGSDSPGILDDIQRAHAAFIAQLRDQKANLASPTFTGAVSGITQAMVGLDKVNNTADADKPVSTLQANAIASATPDASTTVKGKARLATPTEAAAGLDGTAAITPLTLRSGMNAAGSAPIYACRAWVAFQSAGGIVVKGSGNVSSVSANDNGDYTVNFTVSMPDANYAVVGTANRSDTGVPTVIGPFFSPQAGTCRVLNTTTDGVFSSSTHISIAIIR